MELPQVTSSRCYLQKIYSPPSLLGRGSKILWVKKYEVNDHRITVRGLRCATLKKLNVGKGIFVRRRRHFRDERLGSSVHFPRQCTHTSPLDLLTRRKYLKTGDEDDGRNVWRENRVTSIPQVRSALCAHTTSVAKFRKYVEDFSLTSAPFSSHSNGYGVSIVVCASDAQQRDYDDINYPSPS